MTGLSERPSRPPRENRIAEARPRADHGRSTHGAERAALLWLYAAKIAAAQLFASKDQLAAIIEALRAEERAALSALRERHQSEAERKRRVRLAWVFAARGATRRRQFDRPRRRHAHHRIRARPLSR